MDEEDNIFAVILAAYVFESSDNDDQDDQLPQKRRRVWKKKWDRASRARGVLREIVPWIKARRAKITLQFFADDIR